jgi:hypothetical protein
LIDNFYALLWAFFSLSKRKSPFKRNGYHGDFVEQPSKSYNTNLMRSRVFLIQFWYKGFNKSLPQKIENFVKFTLRKKIPIFCVEQQQNLFLKNYLMWRGAASLTSSPYFDCVPGYILTYYKAQGSFCLITFVPFMSFKLSKTLNLVQWAPWYHDFCILQLGSGDCLILKNLRPFYIHYISIPMRFGPIYSFMNVSTKSTVGYTVYRLKTL